MPNISETTLMFIHCLTATHPGSGTALGVVDMPVQRERHTQWPTIPGSSLKGVFRGSFDAEEGWVQTAFGPSTKNASDHAGALTISDARLLAFPVRSLKGVFAWVTCPSVLDRLTRDMNIARWQDDRLSGDWDVNGNAILCPENSPLLIENNGILLEEFDFIRNDDIHGVADWVAEHVVEDKATASRLRSHFAIIADDAFAHFVRHSTEVSARIGLHPETRTVKDGALFWEEHLPPETLFYALVSCSDSRRENDPSKAGEIFTRLRQAIPKTLQIGGNATLGKGLCAIRFPVEEI